MARQAVERRCIVAFVADRVALPGVSVMTTLPMGFSERRHRALIAIDAPCSRRR